MSNRNKDAMRKIDVEPKLKRWTHWAMLLLVLCFCMTARGQLRRYNTSFSYSLKNFVDTIPIDVEGGQIYVTVTMQGRHYRMNVDTGSGQGCLFEGSAVPIAEGLGNVVSRDAAGNRDTVGVVRLQPFQLGRLTVSNYVASVFPRSKVKRPYDGILGFDLINKGLCCKIDVQRKIMILTDRRAFFDGEGGYGVQYKMKWFVPYVLVSPFKRHFDEVLFDTGSRELFTMNKESFDEHAYKSRNVNSQVEGKAEGSFAIGNIGAERRDSVVFLKMDRLRWDQFRFLNVRAITTQGASRLGADMLNYGTVTINGFRRKITFRPYNAADSVEVNNRGYNIAYVPLNGRAGVGLVMPWSNEYKAGLRQGDTIIAVDGEAIGSFEQFISYPFVYGRQYTLLVTDRRGQHKEVIFTR